MTSPVQFTFDALAFHTVLLYVLLVATFMVPSCDSQGRDPSSQGRDLTPPAAKQLYYDLMVAGDYNELIRPSAGDEPKLTVRLGLRLSQVLTVVSSVHYCIMLDKVI